METSELSLYIPRRLSKTLVSSKFLTKVKSDTLVVIHSLGTKKKIEDLYRGCEQISNILLAENRDLTNTRRYKRLHHFNVAECGNLEWLHSEGDMEELRNYLENQTEFVEEKRFLNHECESKINLLVGEAGIGKSSFTKRFNSGFVPNFWTVILDRIDMNVLSKKKDDFMEYILEKKCPQNGLDKKILKILTENHQVVYIWDGIDEIISENVESICVLIERLSNQNFTQWVTSRIHLKNVLEKRFQVFAKSLEVLSTDELLSYARKCLAGKYSEKDFKEFFELMPSDIFKIPLQLFMLTEILKRDGNYFKLSKKLFKMTDLYQHFIDEKFNIMFTDRAGLSSGMSAVEEDMRQEYKSGLLNNLQKVAAYILVPELSPCPRDFLQRIQKIGDHLGFIIKIDGDNNPYFMHISYAEYFLATYFVQNYTRLPTLKAILFKEELTNVRLMFDLLLATDSEPHVAFLQRNFQQLTDLDFGNCRDSGGRNVLHLAASWGFRYPRVKVSCSKRVYVIKNDEDYENSQFDSAQYRDVIQDVVNNCDTSVKDEVFQMNPLEYAETCQCLLAKVKILLERGTRFVTLNDDVSLAGFVLYQVLDYSEDLFRLYENLPMISLENPFYNTTTLNRAIENEKVLEFVLKNDSLRKMVNVNPSQFDYPALNYACCFGTKKSVEVLIAAGANLKSKCLYGTPFICACKNGDIEIAKLLVEKGCNAKVTDRFGRTALHFACSRGHKHIVEFLILQLKLKIDAVDNDGSTPFLSACEEGHIETAKLLIENGCNPNATDKHGQTALHLACCTGYRHVVEFLVLQLKMEIDARSNNDSTPIIEACRFGHVEIIKLLLEEGCNLNATKKDGSTALHWACRCSHKNIAEMLLNRGVMINAVTRKGETPLHFVCRSFRYYYGTSAVAELLIKRGADINAVDKEGLTPIRSAIERKMFDIVQLLKESGAQEQEQQQRQEHTCSFLQCLHVM